MFDQLPQEQVRDLLELAIAEDLPSGDVTSESIGLDHCNSRGEIVAKQSAVVCGLPVLENLAALVSPELRLQAEVSEGASVECGQRIAVCSGSLKDLLAFERTALNFLQHLSGIATHVRGLREQVSALELLDTRKTTPGYRALEKYAVRVGGGKNHRMSLSDQVLIKDNHIDGAGVGGGELVRRARTAVSREIPIEIEVRRFEELEDVLASKPDIILLDNMSVETLRKSIAYIRTLFPQLPIEISGNITKERFGELEALAQQYGYLRASMGNLTYGASWIDFSLKIQIEAKG